MTKAEAAEVRKGDYLTCPNDYPPRQPRRVSQVWRNSSTGLVLIRFAAIGGAWVPATEYELPPKGMGWDHFAFNWRAPNESDKVLRSMHIITKAEDERRKAERALGVANSRTAAA